MKLIFSTIILLCAVFQASAQFDTGTKSLSIPPIKSTAKPATTTPPTTTSNTPSLFGGATKPQPSLGTYQIGKKNDNVMLQNNTMVSSGIMYEDKLQKSLPKGEGDDSKEYRRNQYLGDFKSKAKSIKVKYRDFGAVDGDLIKIYVNDVVIKDVVALDSDFQGFDLELVPGFNKIVFEALNQGTSGPNTAEFQVRDDKGNLISGDQWNLATGFKATIIVVKEE